MADRWEAARALIDAVETAIQFGYADQWAAVLRAHAALAPPAPRSRAAVMERRRWILARVNDWLPVRPTESDLRSLIVVQGPEVERSPTAGRGMYPLPSMAKQLASAEPSFATLTEPQIREAMAGAFRDSVGGSPGAVHVAAVLAVACKAFGEGPKAEDGNNAKQRLRKAIARAEKNFEKARDVKPKKHTA